MMRFTFNINKKHVIVILLLLVVSGFGIAQTATSNPRHDSNEVWVRSITQPGHPTFNAQTLESWLGWLGGRVLDDGQSIATLQSGQGSSSVEAGNEIYIGRGVYGAVGLKLSDIPLSSFSAIKKVRIDIISTAGSYVNEATCPEMVLDSSNGFRMTCGASGPRSYLWSGTECDTPANTDWVSFDVYGLNPSNFKDRIENDGISKIVTILCDDSTGSGGVTFDLYVTPYASKIQDRRIHPFIGTMNPIIFNWVSGN